MIKAYFFYLKKQVFCLAIYYNQIKYRVRPEFWIVYSSFILILSLFGVINREIFRQIQEICFMLTIKRVFGVRPIVRNLASAYYERSKNPLYSGWPAQNARWNRDNRIG